jgi:hypothetical protein
MGHFCKFNKASPDGNIWVEEKVMSGEEKMTCLSPKLVIFKDLHPCYAHVFMEGTKRVILVARKWP